MNYNEHTKNQKYSNFIKNHKGDQIVNLDNVTSIMFDPRKIIFNMNYGISLSTRKDQIIPDYVYFYIDKDNRDSSKNLKRILQHYGWFSFSKSDNSNRWVNPQNISFVKTEIRIKNSKRKYRIIINLANTVSLSNDIFSKTSDAVYYDFDNEKDFESAIIALNDYLEPVKI